MLCPRLLVLHVETKSGQTATGYPLLLLLLLLLPLLLVLLLLSSLLLLLLCLQW